jgi:phytoene synthase
MSQLTASYSYCRRLARRSASSFYYSFWLLPRPQRQAMYALYAYLRQTDDWGDSAEPIESRRTALAGWRRSLERALDGRMEAPFDEQCAGRLWPALADCVRRFDVPPELLFAVIDGVEMDLDRSRYQSFAELSEYCYRVASVVGLACIHIWGFRDPAALEPARQCGLAFQLTNILRDLKEDADRDRVYLPQEDLDRFGYTVADLKRGVRDGRFRALMQFEIERAEALYQQAAELEHWLEPAGRRIFSAMLATYAALLAEIKRRDGDVLSTRIRLNWWRKLQIAGRGLLRARHVLPPVEVIEK